MAAYRALTQAGVTNRTAAGLTGVARATADRSTRRGASTPTATSRSGLRPRSAPPNRLSAAERVEVLAVLNSAEFVDCTPLQVYAVLLDRGQYL